MNRHRFSKNICLAVLLWLISKVTHAACIGVVTAGGGVDFWHKVGEGAIQAGHEHNFEVIVRGPKDVATTERQHKLVEHMLSVGCVGVVVAPNSLERLTQLSELGEKGVHSVLIDRDFGSDEFSVVKTNNYKAGQAAAREMISLLPPEANIALLRLRSDISSTSDREQGFLDEINDTDLNLIVNDYIGTNRTEATTRAFELLSDYPETNAIFTPNESTTMAVLNIRKRLGIANSTVHIGFDSHPSFIAAIEKNELHAIVVQKPYDMGYLAVKKLVQLLNPDQKLGLEDPSIMTSKRIETPVLFVDKQDLVR